MATKTKWLIDPDHSSIGFTVKHLMVSRVRGQFEKFEGEIEMEEEDIKTANATVTIQTDSVSTNKLDRDNHLRSDDFFNAATFPNMVFKSKSYDGEHLIGDLTIRDITKEVKLYGYLNGFVTDQYGQTKAGFEIKGDISRKDFNLKWNGITEAGEIVASDRVNIDIDAQFIKQEKTAASAPAIHEEA